jgi:hypothetical protein
LPCLSETHATCRHSSPFLIHHGFHT